MKTESGPRLRADGEAASAGDVGSRKRLPWVLGASAAVVAVGVFVLVWFQPQKLFIDDRVDQPVPTAGPITTAADQVEPSGAASREPGTTTTVPAVPVDLATGAFVSLDHATEGTVRILELADVQRFVRLEGFETENGPDLFVYLSANPAVGAEAAFDDTYHNLGRLQGTIGDQNYGLPADVDPASFASVVVWCDRFDAAFGAADLVAAPAA